MGRVVHCTLTSPQAKFYGITMDGTYEMNYYFSHGLVLYLKTHEEYHWTLIVSNDYDHGNGD